MLSSCSGVVLERIRPQSPKSTCALLRARGDLDSRAPALSTAGTVFGMSSTTVTPPAAAAAVSVPKSSFSGKPGSRLWTCTSTAPGKMYLPRASTSVPSAVSARPGSTLVTTPSLTSTSASRGPVGVYTVPLRIRSSVKFEVLNPEQRRIRDARGLDVFLPALASVEHDNKVDDVEACVAQHLDRAERVAAGGHDILDHGDAFARCETSFDLLARPVTLRLLAHQQQRKTGLHRDRATEKHSAQLGRGKTLCRFGHQRREAATEAPEQLWFRLKKKFVEVAIRALA